MDPTNHDPLSLTFVVDRHHQDLRRVADAARLRRRVAKRRSAC